MEPGYGKPSTQLLESFYKSCMKFADCEFYWDPCTGEILTSTDAKASLITYKDICWLITMMEITLCRVKKEAEDALKAYESEMRSYPFDGCGKRSCIYDKIAERSEREKKLEVPMGTQDPYDEVEVRSYFEEKK